MESASWKNEAVNFHIRLFVLLFTVSAARPQGGGLKASLALGATVDPSDSNRNIAYLQDDFLHI